MAAEGSDSSSSSSDSSSRKSPLLGGIALLLTAGVSCVAGFGATFALAKKRGSGDLPPTSADAQRHHEATRLAVRALKIGTVYSVCGVASVCAIAWLLAPTLRRILPQPKPRESVGRNEFASIKELVDYILQEDSSK